MTKSIKIADLPALNEEERDDAAFRAKDLAWAALAQIFDFYAETQKLTYEKVGQRIKRSKSHIQRWFASPFNMSLKSLGLLAEALNADLIITLIPRAQPARGQNHFHPLHAVGLPNVAQAWSTPTHDSDHSLVGRSVAPDPLTEGFVVEEEPDGSGSSDLLMSVSAS
jgi:hypothetical protein